MLKKENVFFEGMIDDTISSKLKELYKYDTNVGKFVGMFVYEGSLYSVLPKTFLYKKEDKDRLNHTRLVYQALRRYKNDDLSCRCSKISSPTPISSTRHPPWPKCRCLHGKFSKMMTFGHASRQNDNFCMQKV